MRMKSNFPIVWHTSHVDHFVSYLLPILGAESYNKKPRWIQGRNGLVFGVYARKPGMLSMIQQFAMRVHSCVVMFLGYDILLLEAQYRMYKDLYESIFRRCVLATDGGPSTVERIQNVIGRREIHQVRLPPKEVFSCMPFPTGVFKISCRQAPRLHDKYRLPLMMDVARMVPDVSFVCHHVQGFPRQHWPKNLPDNMVILERSIEDMRGFLLGVSCAIRLPESDTYSMIAIETKQAGRPVISNSRDMPYMLHCEPVASMLVQRIRQAQELAMQHPSGLEEESQFYCDQHCPSRFVDTMNRLWKGRAQ